MTQPYPHFYFTLVVYTSINPGWGSIDTQNCRWRDSRLKQIFLLSKMNKWWKQILLTTREKWHDQSRGKQRRGGGDGWLSLLDFSTLCYSLWWQIRAAFSIWTWGTSFTLTQRRSWPEHCLFSRVQNTYVVSSENQILEVFFFWVCISNDTWFKCFSFKYYDHTFDSTKQKSDHNPTSSEFSGTIFPVPFQFHIDICFELL